MGAWGHGYFEDDAALDFVADVEESDNPKKVIQKAFDAAIKADYLESDAGCAVIVGATYVDRKVNGTKFSPQHTEESIEVDTFPLAEGSELNDLWAENEDDYSAWKAGVEQLIQRLNK